MVLTRLFATFLGMFILGFIVIWVVLSLICLHSDFMQHRIKFIIKKKFPNLVFFSQNIFQPNTEQFDWTQKRYEKNFHPFKMIKTITVYGYVINCIAFFHQIRPATHFCLVLALNCTVKYLRQHFLTHQSTCPANVVSQACLFITMLN